MYNKLRQKIIEQKKGIYYNYHKLKIEIMDAFNKNIINKHEADSLINIL